MNIIYKVWKRKLKKHSNINKHTEFKLLDVGCGIGNFLRCVSKWYPKSSLYGLDISPDSLKSAQSNVFAEFSLGCAENLPYENHCFDVVCSHHVIEHLSNPQLFFSEAKRVLKINGLLIIATPNPLGIAAKFHKDKWMGYIDEHISLISPHCWKEMIQKEGFSILEDGTTFLSGLKILHTFPLSLINWIPLAIFGFFPWYKGEAYMAIARKNNND